GRRHADLRAWTIPLLFSESAAGGVLIQQDLNPFGRIFEAAGKKRIHSISPEEVQTSLAKHKLIVLRGFEIPGRDEFLAFCKGFSSMQTLNWSFGPIMEMKEDPNPENYLFSREKVPFHWDGAFHKVPDYLMFSCVEAPWESSGGETLFANTELIYRDASMQEKKLWSEAKFRYQTKKLAHYGGVVEGPLVQAHPESGRMILRFAEPVSTKLNPVSLEVLGLPPEQGREI